MITAADLRKRAQLESVIRITDEEAEYLVQVLVEAAADRSGGAYNDGYEDGYADASNECQ